MLVRRLRRAAVMLLLGCTALAAASCTAGTEDADDGTLSMVALGDSVASGAGIEPSSQPCARSERNYPSLVAKALGAELDDMTCGGATTETLLNGSDESGAMKRAPQVDALGDDTDLVTLTIGANDGDAAARYFTACFIPPANTASACAEAVEENVAALEDTGPDVVATIDRIRDRAPAARIVLVGYLPLTPPTGCATTPIAPTAVAGLAGYEGQLERTLVAAADEAEVPFVSVRDASQGHDSCSQDAWVNGLQPAEGDGAFLHPTAAGAAAIADAVEPVLADAGGP